jgi:hypothetical protein
MTPALSVAAVVAFGFALASLLMQVDGAELRRWRLSRRWDISRLAREFIAAADEPLATLRGLKHMINAWERGARKPSERYWLLYLRLFPECANGETAFAGGSEQPADQPDFAPSTPTTPSAPSADSQDIRALAATVRALEQRIAGLSRRLDELSRDERDKRDKRDNRQPREATA